MSAGFSDAPSERKYTIGEAVAALREAFPDVSHSSLRFLEREGLITARRSPGGHRFFDQDDIDRIRQIKTWQQQRISLREIRERLDRKATLADPRYLEQAFLDHATGGRLVEAYRVVMEAAVAGVSPAVLFGGVLVPALTEVGDRWHRGELLVAQEKEISELARELVTEITLRYLPQQAKGAVIVAACVESERHELGLRMLCGLLRIEGYGIHFLGADVAPLFLQQAVRLHQPAAVLLSAHTVERLPDVQSAVIAVAEAIPARLPPQVFIGGQGVPKMMDAIQGLGIIAVTASRFEDAMRQIQAALPVAHQPERQEQA